MVFPSQVQQPSDGDTQPPATSSPDLQLEQARADLDLCFDRLAQVTAELRDAQQLAEAAQSNVSKHEANYQQAKQEHDRVFQSVHERLIAQMRQVAS